MLTPDYFYGKSDKLIEMYQELEDWILQDIAMRLMKAGELSGTADRELWKLQQMGLHYEEIVKKIAQLTKKSKGEVRKLLNDSVMTSYSNDVDVLNMYGSTEPPNIHEAARMAANAEFVKTCGELSNLTRTTMVQSQRDLLNMLNEVDYRVASGMQSYSSAICEVLDRYAHRGVVVDYPTGAKRSLDSAVRCCIVTSMNQTAAQVTNQYIVEGGIEYVLVSEHMGARHNDNYPYGVESHDYWQGRVYKVVGSEDGIPNLTEATGYSIDLATGQGNAVNPLGLHGYNCRHSHRPWDKSLRNPYVDADGNPKIDVHESMEQYDNQQKQRAMERNIRQTKRQLLMKKQEIDGIAETDVKELLQPEYDKLAYKLRKQNKAYNAFCEQNNLQKQSDRLKVAGFKKKQSTVANGRATVYANQVAAKRIPQIPASTITEKIHNGQYSTRLSSQQFDKHVLGTAKYEEYLNTRLSGGGNPQSVITISKDEAQKIIETKAGTGIIKVDRNGNARPQEQITCDNIIGQYYYDGQYIDTNKTVIHYGKRNSHIVPVKGDNYD